METGMSEHIVRAYDEDLATLKTMLAQMGGLVEQQLDDAIDALSRRDTQLADRVIQNDEKVDIFEHQIEEKAIMTIARRQPVARDLREIMVAIRVSSDLERIGDLAKNTAKRTHAMSEAVPRKLMAGVIRMGRLAQEELKNILDAYARSDAGKALEVWRSDEDLDALYNSIFRELLTYMMEDPRNISLCTHLLFGAKNMERIGDHATNIAENIHYLVHGKPLVEGRPKKDTTSMLHVDAPQGPDRA
jgi:phosphate transport system protein